MQKSFPNLCRCISIMDRLTKMYYNRCLADTKIGWGQQFYLEYIHDHPGTTAQEMVEFIRVDKATLTKNIKFLGGLGYLEVKTDENDKRVKHLYLTQSATQVAEKIKSIHEEFYQILSESLSPEDLTDTESVLEKMIDNVNSKVWHRMEANNG